MEDHSFPSTNTNTTHTHSNHENGLHIGDINGELLSDLLGDIRVDHSLPSPDMRAIKKESFQRTRAAMVVIHPAIAKKILPLPDDISRQVSAAICIQAFFRGYLARKKYVQLLYKFFVKEEEEMNERTRQQLEEGELLIDNYRLKCEMDDNACLRRNQRRNLDCSVITIQRAWRKHKRKSQDGIDDESYAYSTPTFASSLEEHLGEEQNAVHIRTNPFSDQDSDQDSDDQVDSQADVFNDSLEQIMEENNHRNNQEHNSLQEGLDVDECFPGDFYGDETLGLEAITMPMYLPSPTTDWESIESCLNSQGEMQDFDNNDLSDIHGKRLTDFTLKANNLQICFVDDDGLLSDADGSVDECEIKEYIIDKQELSEEEKRDSGCVAGDEEGSETFSIKTVNPEALENTRVSANDLQQVMLELNRQDSVEEVEQEEECLYQGWTTERLEELTLEELRELRNNTSQVISAQNEVLVQELMDRDYLHLKQDSLLMEVEDSSKLAQAKYKMSQRAKKRT